MKVKFTNNVKNRRNIRKRQIGSLVTGALRYQNEASLENLAVQVSRRLNRTIAQIYPAVIVTLNCGVRDGFITKHGNKYSLSSRRNYETDVDRPIDFLVTNIGDIVDVHEKSFEKCHEELKKTNCEAVSDVTKCSALDLMTFGRCSYKKLATRKPPSNYCRFHERVLLIFRYMKFYFENIVHVLQCYWNGSIIYHYSIVGWLNKLVLELDRTREAAVIYVEFLQRFIDTIKNNNPVDFPFQNVLRGQQTGIGKSAKENPYECVGTKLKDDGNFGNVCKENRDSGGLCGSHIFLRTLQKLVMHGDVIGDGLHPATVAAIFNQIVSPFKNHEIHTLSTLPKCERLYVSLVIRLADIAISQFKNTGYNDVTWRTVTTVSSKTNELADGNYIHGCICQCVGDITLERLWEIHTNIAENQYYPPAARHYGHGS